MIRIGTGDHLSLHIAAQAHLYSYVLLLDYCPMLFLDMDDVA